MGTAVDAVHRMRLLLRCTCRQEAHAEDSRVLRLLKTRSRNRLRPGEIRVDYIVVSVFGIQGVMTSPDAVLQ